MDNYAILQRLEGSGFQVAAVFICTSCLYFTLVRSKPDKLFNKVFLMILLNILLTSVCDITNVMTQPFVTGYRSARIIQEVDYFVYFLLSIILSPLFCFYISLVTGARYRLKRNHHFLYILPMYVSVFLVLINPITGWVYDFDENYLFIRGWATNILYVVSSVYFCSAVAMILFFWNAINSKKRKTLIYFFATVAVGAVVQYLYPELHTELFAEALAMTGIMIIIENEEDRKNPRIGIYNETAFAADVRTLIISKRDFGIICIKMLKPQNVMQIVGPMNIENLTKTTADYLATIIPNSDLYYLNPGTFVILNQNEEQSKNLEKARTIYERFQQEWDFQGSKTVFHAAVFCAEVPKDFKTQEEIMVLIGSPMIPNNNKKNDVYYGKDLEYFLRRMQVEKGITNGLENHNFEVYYQPIYDARDMSIRSGEALLRLHDSEIGKIYPNEFLTIAEQRGLIFELGDFVLEEVCIFLNSGIPVEMGIETLNINLSVIQCIQPSYAERIIEIVSKYDIDPCRINFEITESAATTDFEGLKQFVKTLYEYGFHFSVDDYGVGYSNVHSIFSLDVDVIKIDRTILWEAEQTGIGRIIMESSVSMLKRLGKKILISGVESKTQIALASEFGVDYLQGFFFSNPISQNEFINILKATQLARMEEQRALAANEAMSSFLANMSHEIRTPINAVLGMDEMILRECEDDRIIEYARTIEGAGRTLLSLVNDILDFSKIEAGNMDIVEGEYELSSVLSDVVKMIQIKTNQKGLRLLVDVDPATPNSLYGDEMRLRQIVINILNNAVKYTEKGTVAFQIGYESIRKNQIKLKFVVRDTGIGIKEEDMDKLFQKFQRVDQDRNKTIEGSGLGLAIVHRLLELMDGTIEVESVYGKGSKFTVTLPQKVVADKNIGDFRKKFAKENEKIHKYKESFQAPEARILVVDDTPMNLFVVKELLKKTQLTVDEANSGEECLKMAEEQEYDIIFLDYRMPVMDGIETLKRLKELPDSKNSNIPIVALTANAISGARERFIREGFDDYMTKPIDGERLEELLLMYLPDDKIQKSEVVSLSHKIEEKGESGEQEGESAVRSQPVLDREQGIRNCGSEETYYKVLEAFQNDIKGKADIIRQALESRDLERYGITVHAIKSSSGIIGASTLAKLAEQLELAADQGDVRQIEDNTQALLDLYEGYLELDIDQGKQKVKDDKERPIITNELWTDACSTIREFAYNMDYDNVMLVLESMDEYRLSQSRQQEEKEIRELVLQLKWEELIKKMDSIL